VIGTSLLLVSVLELPEVIAVRSERVSEGVAIKILTTAALQNVETVRNGESAVVTLPAQLPPHPLELPAALVPLRSIAFEGDATQARIRVSWAPGATFESRVDGSLVTLMFRSQDQPPANRDVERLYPMLFPQSSADPIAATDSPPASGGSLEPESRAGALTVGPFRLKPAFAARYIETTATLLETPQPIAARYVEIQPAMLLVAGSELERARLSLNYEPRFRTSNQNIPALSKPSHIFTGVVDFTVGSGLKLSVAERLHRATLETEVLDPGREYFYDLGRFRRNELGLSARTETAGRLDWNLSAIRVSENVEQGTGYFDNVRETVFLGPRYELGAGSDLMLRYEFERIPPPSTRPVVESRAHALLMVFDGEVATSTRATVAAGFRREHHPRVAAPGDRFRGLTLSASLRRDFLNGANVILAAGRTTHPSAFEGNAFYLANRLDGSLALPVPASIWMTLGARSQRNDYRLLATGLAVRREDRLSGWSAGLSRNITSWSSIKLDYHWDRRVSNVPGLTTRTHSFVAQAGFGALRPGVGR